MIISCNGALTINGSGIDVLAEMTQVLHGVRESLVENGLTKKEADEWIDHAVKISRMSADEVLTENEKKLRTMLYELVDEIMGKKEDSNV